MKTKPFEELKLEIELAMQARDWGRIERSTNADLRHNINAELFDYLRHFCNVGRIFAYATPDYSWGEFEKEFAIIIRQAAQGRVLFELIREHKQAADAGRRAELWAEISQIVEE